MSVVVITIKSKTLTLAELMKYVKDSLEEEGFYQPDSGKGISN